MSTMWLKCLILLWWLCNTSYHFQNIDIYQEQPRSNNWKIFIKYQRFLEMTMLQFLAGAVASGLILKLTKKKLLALPAFDKNIFVLVVLGHISGTIAVNAAISMHSIYIQHVLRSFEPVLVFILSLHRGYKIRRTVLILCGLVFVSTGIYTFIMHENLVFTQWGVIVAVIPVFMFPLRNVYLKAFGDTWEDPVQKYLVISSCGFLILLPVVLIKLSYTRILPVLSPAMTLKSVAFNIVNTLITVFLLQLISPLFHSVFEKLIQYSIAIMTVMYFAIPISWHMSIGMVLFLVGFVLYYQKFISCNVHELRRFFMIAVVTLHLIFGANLLRTVEFSRTTSMRLHTSTVIHTFWVYSRPPSRDVLMNMERVYQKTLINKLHVFCGTFSCRRKVLKHPRISTGFLNFKDIVRNSPLEQWFKTHSLNKILSRNFYEDHFHEATRLALLWRYGGTYVDPFLRIPEKPFWEQQNHHSWVTKITTNNSWGILLACRFKKRHPFVKELADIFVKSYYQLCYMTQHCEKLLTDFNAQSLQALVDFCSKSTRSCPETVEIVLQRMNGDNQIYTKGFDTKIFERFKRKSLSIGIQTLAILQFFPFVEGFKSIDGYIAKKSNSAPFETIAHFFQAFGQQLHSIILAERLDPKEGYSLEYVAYLRQMAPIGCLERRTVNFLRSHNIEAYLSGGISILMKSPLRYGTARKNIYIVALNQGVMEQLPKEIRDLGLRLSFGKKSKLSASSWLISIFVYLKKIAAARLVITGDVSCASVAVAFDTPVLLVRSDGESNKIPSTVQDVLQVFHTLDPKNSTLNSTTALISNLLSGEIPAMADHSLFMRLRSTTWSAIRGHEPALESALKFNVVPFTRPRLNIAKRTTVFHLIFTTSEQSLISLEDQTRRGKNVKGNFAWRHWRCIESIFYHHPDATVTIHTNTLSSKLFDVLRESGYDIQVKPYSLADLAKGTPAEVFVRDELAYAREGEHWYSHETDLLRLLILYKFGGIYMDIDMIIVRKLRSLPRNVVGWESVYNLNGAFLKFQKRHAYLYACIKRFSERYSQAWSDNGPLLLSQVWREWSQTNPHNDVRTVAHTAFYMFFYRSIQRQCFEDTSGATFEMNWNTLRNRAYAVHLYSKVTAGYGGKDKAIKGGTLCKYILNTFCVLCIKVY